MQKLLSGIFLLGLSPACLALQIFACEPEWAALAEELTGERAEIFSATTALQDPHHIQARPGLIARARRADLLICTGAGLESGWLPVLLRQARNPAIQPGKPGYFEAAAFVTMLDVPTDVDRSHGDVHPQGNPHIQTDPRRLAAVAVALVKRLAEVDPETAEHYRKRHEDFSKRWSAAIENWERQAVPLRGSQVVTQHRSWNYLFDWLGIVEQATLEPKPGLPPSASSLAAVKQRLKSHPARMVVRAAYQDERPSQWLAANSELPVVTLPFTVGGTEDADNLFNLFAVTIQRLLEHQQ